MAGSSFLWILLWSTRGCWYCLSGCPGYVHRYSSPLSLYGRQGSLGGWSRLMLSSRFRLYFCCRRTFSVYIIGSLVSGTSLYSSISSLSCRRLKKYIWSGVSVLVCRFSIFTSLRLSTFVFNSAWCAIFSFVYDICLCLGYTCSGSW